MGRQSFDFLPAVAEIDGGLFIAVHYVLAFHVQYVNGVTGILEERSEVLLALPQCLFHLLSFGDVFNRSKVTGYIALFVLDPRGADDHWKALSVFPHESQFKVTEFALQGLLERYFYLFVGLRWPI